MLRLNKEYKNAKGNKINRNNGRVFVYVHMQMPH